MEYRSTEPNFFQLLWALGLPRASTAAREVLSAHRDYALALLATKDRPTVLVDRLPLDATPRWLRGADAVHRCL